MEYKKYICGLAFDPYYTKVILIKKNRPEWQVGMWNAVGGKYEPDVDKSYVDGIVREFKEETGLDTTTDMWREFAILTGHGYQISWFTTTLKDRDLFKATTVEDEEVRVVNLSDIGNMNLIPNVRWLIEMAKSGINEPPVMYHITESYCG